MRINYIFSTLIVFAFFYSSTHAQTEFKKDSIHQFSWNSTINDWVHNTRELFTYDNGGTKETNLLRLNLNGTQWQNFYQFNKTYNSNNNLIEEIQQNWNGSAWQNYTRESYQYDTFNNVQLFSYAIFSSGNWLTFNQNHYTYDSANNLIENIETELDFNTMTQVDDKRWLYDYTGSLKNYEIYQEWLDFANIWDNRDRTEYSYNSNQDITLEELLGWNVIDEAWSAPYRQFIYSYNTDDLVEEILEQLIVNDQWQNYTRTVNTYINGNLTDITFQDWNTSTETWENANRQLRTFDANGNEIELIYQTWDTTTNSWLGITRIVSFWSPPETLSFNEIKETDYVSIYPNPTSDYINITSSQPIHSIKVYSLTGKLVLKGFDKQSLNITSLQSGVYLVKISSNRYSITKKIIIKS